MSEFMGHHIAKRGVITATAGAEKINAGAVVVGVARVGDIGVDTKR